MKSNNELQNLVSEILKTWQDFAMPDADKRLGRTLQALLDMATSFCREEKWPQARRCCEMGAEVLALGWDQRGRMDVGLADAAVMFHLATTYLGQKKREVALDYYKKSGDAFNSKMAWMAASVLWFIVGKVYSLQVELEKEMWQAEWEKAMWAFQRSLNMLENLPARSQKTDEFRERIEPEFDKAKNGLNELLRAPSKIPSESDAAADEGEMNVRELPIVQEIAAGPGRTTGEAIRKASLSIEGNIIDTITIDREHSKGADIGFKVRGVSMIEAGIIEGDYALIRLVNVAANGETVIATVTPFGESGDLAEATLKKFYKEESEPTHYRLQPMNSAVTPIIVVPPGADPKAVQSIYLKRGIQTDPRVGEVHIVGKLVAIWRKAEK